MPLQVRCSSQQRGELKDLAQIFRGHICDVGINSISIEVMGKTEKMATLQLLLEPYGIIEVARTGTVSMVRPTPCPLLARPPAASGAFRLVPLPTPPPRALVGRRC